MHSRRRQILLGVARAWVVLLAARIGVAGAQEKPAPPISLHPDNPHYLLFRGKPTVLITSGEHYGAVLNLDFDHEPYLKELESKGLNLTRVFSGAYVESPQSFGIERNTLAPAEGRFICPWARSDQPGYPRGGNKFDLSRWDEAYFERLRRFVAEAGRRGVVVEFVLFCPFYEDHQWEISPQNARNNVNAVGDLPRTDVYTLKNGKLLAVQDAMVRKVVAELKDFDNLYYEVCNEPYFGGVTMEWQHHVIETILDAEKDFPRKHLIAQNIANGAAKIENPHPAVSIFNFHYATPPDAVGMNYGLNKVIGDDETGFRGTEDVHYRTEAWDFLLAGGAIFDHLDYSFTADHEDGSFYPLPPKQPGGGGPALRQQLGVLKRFMDGMDFTAMKPDNAVIKGGVPAGASARVLAQAGRTYAVYIRGGDGKAFTLSLDLPAGNYRGEWLNPRSGDIEKSEDRRRAGGPAEFASPPYSEDIALRVTAAGE